MKIRNIRFSFEKLCKNISKKHCSFITFNACLVILGYFNLIKYFFTKKKTYTVLFESSNINIPTKKNLKKKFQCKTLSSYKRFIGSNDNCN